MKRNKLYAIFLILTLLLSICTSLASATGLQAAPSADDASTQITPNATAQFSVDAKAALLIERNTGEVLFEQNADAQLFPASLTKIMTCLLALENGNLSDEITVTESAMENLSEYGSTADLQVGEVLTLEELLYCMMLWSANEACNVVGEYVAGSVDAFVEMMNQRATELGCTNTHFVNTHGLHDDNHYTTARDLSLIAEAALKSEAFQTITHAVTHEVPATNLSGPRKLTTTNNLINPNGVPNYYYEYAEGVKTGFTTPAGRCLISTADNGKLSLLTVVMGTVDVPLETGENELKSFTETRKLMDYGFDTFAYAKVLDTLPITEIPVTLSAGPEAAVLTPDQEITGLLPANYDPAQIQKDIKLQSETGVEAPITKGQKLGTVTVSYQGKELGTANLVAITEIARSEVEATKATTKSFFSENWLKLFIGVIVLLIALYFAVICINRARRRRYRRRKREMMRRRNGEIIDFPGNQHERKK